MEANGGLEWGWQREMTLNDCMTKGGALSSVYHEGEGEWDGNCHCGALLI